MTPALRESSNYSAMSQCRLRIIQFVIQSFIMMVKDGEL